VNDTRVDAKSEENGRGRSSEGASQQRMVQGTAHEKLQISQQKRGDDDRGADCGRAAVELR
jgi:hypothetical protein